MEYNLRSRAGASQWTLGFAPTQAPSDTAPTSAGPQYTSTQYSQAFPAGGLYVEGPPTLSPIPTGSQITYSQALQLVSTPVGDGASLVSEDKEVDNILATTPEVDDDITIPDTAVADYELPPRFPHLPHPHLLLLPLVPLVKVRHRSGPSPSSCLPTLPSRRGPRSSSQILQQD